MRTKFRVVGNRTHSHGKANPPVAADQFKPAQPHRLLMRSGSASACVCTKKEGCLAVRQPSRLHFLVFPLERFDLVGLLDPLLVLDFVAHQHFGGRFAVFVSVLFDQALDRFMQPLPFYFCFVQVFQIINAASESPSFRPQQLTGCIRCRYRFSCQMLSWQRQIRHWRTRKQPQR